VYANTFGVGNKKALSLEEAVAMASTLANFEPVANKAFKFNEPNPQLAQLFRTWREGSFAYKIPLQNGKYSVRLSFFEPDSKAAAGTRKFDIVQRRFRRKRTRCVRGGWRSHEGRSA
jgi:hypothetical protein